jgi:hypothetical protein
MLHSLEGFPIVFLNGARQTGKSTFTKMLAEKWKETGREATYVTFDRPVVQAAASSAPEAFLGSYPRPLIIDEVQMVPELFRALKIEADQRRFSDKSEANGQFLLTGSANILALPNLSDALVGRMAVLTLHPFTVAEASRHTSGQLDKLMNLDLGFITDRGISLMEAMQMATFPEIAFASREQRSMWFDSYITTILQRDVRQMADIEKAHLLPHLLRILATRVGGMINESDISREAGLNSVTGKTYRNILKWMFLSFDIKPWTRNIGKRLVKAPKNYLSDTQLACHLLDLNLEEISHTKPELFGHLLENFVATELIKQLSFSTTRAELYHFRTSDNKEVDFILEKPNGSIFAIEVKRSELITADDFRHIRLIQESTGADFSGGIVLYLGKDIVPFGEKRWAVPIHALWA